MLLSNQEAESVSGNRISGFGAADDAERHGKVRIAYGRTGNRRTTERGKEQASVNSIKCWKNLRFHTVKSYIEALRNACSKYTFAAGALFSELPTIFGNGRTVDDELVGGGIGLSPGKLGRSDTKYWQINGLNGNGRSD